MCIQDSGDVQPEVARYVVMSVVCVRVDPLPYAHSVQERLTKEIAEAVLDAVHPTGVGVVVEAT